MDFTARINFITLCASLLVTHGLGAVTVSISPSKAVAAIDDKVAISCVAEMDEEVTLMELTRNDEDPIVFLRDCSNVTFRSDLMSKLQATGRIGKEGGPHFLNVTLTQTESADTGIYTCLVYYMDQAGRLKMEEASGNLEIEKLDVRSLESVLNGLKSKISTLEDKQQDARSLERLNARSLDLALNDIKSNISTLKDKLTYSSSFSVSNNAQIKTYNGNTLILSDIISRQGPGYDVKTGVFTAPVSGLYTFHVVFRSDKASAIYVNLDLMKNDQAVAKMACDPESGRSSQCSISSIVELKNKDRVYMVMRDGGQTVASDLFTLFNGCLIRLSEY